MTFLFPLGLIGLVGVPIVVIIYILKNKYNEQTVASTYIWSLSERFFKRRNPLSALTGIINLILQILMVIFISLAIARPIVILPQSASEYCFILDCSGSMNMTSNESTRFDLAKDEIENLIKEAKGGSTYTLVTADVNTNTIFERISDKKLALEMLDKINCSNGAIDENQAKAIAQKYFDQNNSLVTYLFTDKEYLSSNGVKVVKFGSPLDVNYSITDALGTLTSGTLKVSALVNAYQGEEELSVNLYIDGQKNPVQTKKIQANASAPTPIEFTYQTENYSSFKVEIQNKDALLYDNEFIYYNQKSESNYDVLLVSETPFFLQAVLDVLSDSTIDVISPDDYEGQTGYGLYIFHSFTPNKLPDSAVWLINSATSVANSGFGIRGIIELDQPKEISMSSSTASTARKLLSGVEGKNIFISEYVKYSGMYAKFTTLFSYESNPLIFAGVNALGNRQVVVGFDLHKADFSLSTDYVALLGNLLAYSCPDVLDKTGYMAGDEVLINITGNVTNVKAFSPDGEEIYIDASTDVGVLNLDKVGTYIVRVTTPETVQECMLYSGAPSVESEVNAKSDGFDLVGVQQFEKTDGEYDPVTIIFILLAVVFIMDWGVYCYEKYQLR